MLLPGFVLGVPVTKHSTTLEALHSIPLFYKESIKATEGVNNYVKPFEINFKHFFSYICQKIQNFRHDDQIIKEINFSSL